ncbi:MAG: DNA-directed RNA polymerase subunit omega [Fusobacteriia bacterium 4572_132]|nr:MAG: DNA-directed RNA polymerase subunit omega [Fusobacteriia bacterium 4572_132]
MQKITFEDLLGKIPNKYSLCVLAGKRAKKILGGEKQLVEVKKRETIVQTVFREIIEGKIGLKDEEY